MNERVSSGPSGAGGVRGGSFRERQRVGRREGPQERSGQGSGRPLSEQLEECGRRIVGKGTAEQWLRVRDRQSGSEGKGTLCEPGWGPGAALGGVLVAGWTVLSGRL